MVEKKIVQIIQTDKRFIISLLLIFGIFAVLFLYPDTSFAIDPTGTGEDAFEQVRKEFEQLATAYGERIRRYALNLFKLFASIGIVFFGIKSAFSRAEISDVLKEFILVILWVAFCGVAIFYSHDWMDYITTTQLNIASHVTGRAPENISIDFSFLAFGFNIIKSINDSISIFSPTSILLGLIYFLIAGVGLACIALVCARMLVILCESYIAMCISVLIMGFGGADFLKDYTINVFRYCISVALKLFTMEIILAVASSFMDKISQMVVQNLNFQTVFIFLVCALLLLVLCQQIPDIVAGIINGAHVGSGAGLAAAAGSLLAASKIMASSVVKTGAAAAHTTGAYSRAHKLASLNGWGNQADRVAKGGIRGSIGKTIAAASEMGRMYSEARQDQRRSGLPINVMQAIRNMNAMSRDRLEVERGAQSAYSQGLYGNQYNYANQQAPFHPSRPVRPSQGVQERFQRNRLRQQMAARRQNARFRKK